MARTPDSPRSDRLRQRRTTRRSDAAPRTTRRKSTASAHYTAPILIRGGLSEMPMAAAPRRNSRTRRRYDIALSVPGAELRLPALPSIRFGWRFISFILVALLSVTLYTLGNAADYRVENIQVNGLQRLTAQEINTLLDVSGEPIFAIDATTLHQTMLEKFPELSSIQISVSLPNNVAVDVVERIPVLVWAQEGRTMWVDTEGYAFPTREIEPPELVLKVEGNPPGMLSDGQNPGQMLSPTFVQAVLRLKEVAPKNRALLYNAEYGLGWKDKKWAVYLGVDLSQIEMKLQVYRAIADRLKKDGIKPALISVEAVHAPYYRLEP